MIPRELRSLGPAVSILLVLFLTTSNPLNGQAPRDAVTDLRLHKFQPKVAPERATPPSAASGQMVNGMSVTAAQQMQALQQDKALRTPAQRKMDSNLIYTARMLAGQPAAPGVLYLNTGVDLDDNNNVVVDIVANVTDQLLQQLNAAGAHVLSTNRALRSIRAVIPPAQIEGIAASPDVIFIWPKQGSMTHRIESPSQANFYLRRNLPPGFEQRAASIRRQLSALLFSIPGTPMTGQGSVETEGDITHRAFDARGTFGVTGAGLNIGVLSNGVSSRAQSQATGDLPADCPATPTCLTVLPAQAGVGDEGTAILEIIHDMVPGANLFFATADNGITSFAQNIRDLRTAGCDIIVDDVFYFVETPFQDGQTAAVVSTSNGGVVTQAVNDVVAAGALYFSSAGNEGNEDDHTSGTFEGDFSGVASAAPLPLTGKVHNFNGTIPYDAITNPGFGIAGLWWADPLGASKNDYDLYVLDSAGTTVVASSTNIQNGTQDPVELLSGLAPGDRLVVFQNTGAADLFFHVVVFRGGLAVNTAGETHGHSAASGAYTVAATPAAAAFEPPTVNGPYPNAFGPANQVEAFTSDGPRQIFFNGDSTAITLGNFSSSGGTILNKPDVTGSDGVSVTGVGGFGNPFYGTSAAAPSAASVAALVKSAQPSLTPAQIRTALTSTAVDIMGAGFDRDSGAGIVMAWEAINSLGVPGSANPELGTITASENPGNGNGVLDAGEGGKLVIQLKNTSGVQAATGISAVLTSSNPSVIITQPNSSGYADMAAGANGGSNLSPFTFTLDSSFACGQPAPFTLTVNYTGGPKRVLNFTVPTGSTLTLSNTLGTKPAGAAGVSTATGTEPNRIFRDGSPSVCGKSKAFPGTFSSGPRAFDSYTFTACQSSCLNVVLKSNTINLFESAYSPSFDPTNLQTNYQGDAGSSFATQSFGISTTAATAYTVVVNDVSGTAVGTSYKLQIPACAINCNVNKLPVAKAHDVTVAAATTGGTVNVNVDNGSFDPDGDPITLTQSPAGPYPLGDTNVLLSVTDPVGATSQAGAKVTVVNPEFNLALTLSSVTVIAGQSATEHVTFIPNPGIGAPLNLSCSGLPSESNCSFSPNPVPANSPQTDVVITITTTAPSAALVRPRTFYAAWLPFSGLGLLGIIVMATPAKRRRAALLMTLLFMGVLMFLAGCGGSSHMTNPGTQKGTFTVTVTGTSGNLTHSGTFSLTVQ